MDANVTTPSRPRFAKQTVSCRITARIDGCNPFGRNRLSTRSAGWNKESEEALFILIKRRTGDLFLSRVTRCSCSSIGPMVAGYFFFLFLLDCSFSSSGLCDNMCMSSLLSRPPHSKEDCGFASYEIRNEFQNEISGHKVATIPMRGRQKSPRRKISPLRGLEMLGLPSTGDNSCLLREWSGFGRWEVLGFQP
ncbi:unnamed protein product [Larinioides sclopetarius]|uniref:Uncharacterized protein n=1 Tax=Larinioides sclopetarius TaxID=280406 RepID=A0AAV1YWB7_9ARAC